MAHEHWYSPTHNADGTITWTCSCGDSFTNGNVKN
jgi:hypothetical protein